MSEMVERMARELRFTLYGVPPQRPFDDDSLWLKVARAVIEAMREPTEAMWKAGVAEQRGTREIWQAMIDAALK